MVKERLLTKNSISTEAILTVEGEIKIFHDKQKTEEFIASNLPLNTKRRPLGLNKRTRHLNLYEEIKSTSKDNY